MLKKDIGATNHDVLADTLAIDSDTVFAAMTDPEISDVINTNRALAQNLQITGTPTFVVDDQLLRG